MLSAICFKLDQPKILSSGNGLNLTIFQRERKSERTILLTNEGQICRSPTLRKQGLTLYRFLMTLYKKPSENIEEKGENAGNQHFLLFPLFSTLSKTNFNFSVT